MRLVRNPKLVLDETPSNERRRHGRLRCEDASCCVGQVIDLSGSGMRVLRRGGQIMEVGDAYTISVHPNAGEPILELPSRVIWIERQGFRKHMIGFEFSELDDLKRTKLSELARIVCDQIVFRCA